MDILDLLKSILSLSLGDFIRRTFGDGPGTELLIDIGGVVMLSTFCLLIVIFLIWLTRKLIARMQDRIGPNRVGGRYGLLQTVADVMKLLSKEVIHPAGADWLAFNAAPLLVVIAALLMWAVMPFAPGVIGVDLNIGIFYVMAISSASVIVILLAGWGSNNKYALLGAFRAVAQMVSYEVPMILSIATVVLLAGSMSTMRMRSLSSSRYSCFRMVLRISASAPANSTPVGPPPTMVKLSCRFCACSSCW